jgi:hypothetical protein
VPFGCARAARHGPESRFLLGDDREQVLDPHRLCARNILDGFFVNLNRDGARDLGPDHAGVQHAGQPHVRRHLQGAEHFPRQIAARRRSADDLEGLRIFELGLPSHCKAEPELAVPLYRGIEITTADQVRIGDAPLCIGRVMNHAVVDRQPLGRNAEGLGGHADHQAARFRRHLTQIHAGPRNAGRGAGAAHVDRAPGVAHDEVHALQRHVEFLGHHLGDGGAQPLSAVDLAVVGGDGAVLFDRNIGIEPIGLERWPGLARHRRRPIGGGERDHEGAGRGDEGAAAEFAGHGSPPSGLRRALDRADRCPMGAAAANQPR